MCLAARKLMFGSYIYLAVIFSWHCCLIKDKIVKEMMDE